MFHPTRIPATALLNTTLRRFRRLLYVSNLTPTPPKPLVPCTGTLHRQAFGAHAFFKAREGRDLFQLHRDLH